MIDVVQLLPSPRPTAGISKQLVQIRVGGSAMEWGGGSHKLGEGIAAPCHSRETKNQKEPLCRPSRAWPRFKLEVWGAGGGAVPTPTPKPVAGRGNS